MKTTIIFDVVIPSELEESEKQKRGRTADIRCKLVADAAKAFSEFAEEKRKDHHKNSGKPVEELKELLLNNGVKVSWRIDK